MGRSAKSADRDGRGRVPEDETHRRLFGAYFPRVFAYVQAMVGDEGRAKSVTAETFATVFATPAGEDERGFAIAVFGAARALCRALRPTERLALDVLTEREREVISLLFDAQLGRSEISRLLEIKEDTVSSSLVRGLRKLRSSVLPPAPSFLRLS